MTILVKFDLRCKRAFTSKISLGFFAARFNFARFSVVEVTVSVTESGDISKYLEAEWGKLRLSVSEINFCDLFI